MTVGLIIKAPHGDAPEANRFYAPVMTGIEEICRVREIDLLFAAMPVDDQYYPLEVPRLLSERSCDGLIVVGAHLSRGTAAIMEDGPPSILVDAYAEDVAFDCVVSDNVAGARAAVEHLIANGHREICLVGSRPDSYPSILQRRRGYEQAIAEAELPAHYVDVAYAPPEAAAAAAVRFLEAHPEVTAAFCCNDAVAVALIQAADRAGIAVPERAVGGRLRRHRPGPVRLAAADHHVRRQAGHGPARGHAAAVPHGVRPGGHDSGLHPPPAGGARIGAPHRRARVGHATAL